MTTNKYETNADFSPAAIQAGAAAVGNTLDGLCFYSAQERSDGGKVLHAQLITAIKNAAGVNVPGITDAVASSLADQLLNVFAFGNSDMAGKSIG